MADSPPADRSQTVSLVPLPDRQRLGAPLPTPLTSFVGRDREVAAVVGLLRRPGVRLVTLTGPGGVGKTRLAIRAAEQIADHFPDGIWFVALAAVGDPALVGATIARALGVRETTARPVEAGVQEFLACRRALLVLDNVEHLLDAAPLVADLLSACRDLTVLTTSRTVLRVSGEHAIGVPPLGLPTPDRRPPVSDALDIEAIRLFVERAIAGRVDFALTEANLGAVGEICCRLDGLPLAIELAASRVRHLPPAVLLTRLESRLPLLTGGARDLPARLRTMRDAIAWSYDLLTPAEQALFRRLSVFAGGFGLEAAEWLMGDAPNPNLEGIASLVDKSLVSQSDGKGADGSPEPRYVMLETIREFGREQLEAVGEAEACLQKHADWYGRLAERVWDAIEYGEIRASFLDWVEAEHDNLRAALAWLEQRGDAEATVGLAGHLYAFWKVRGHLIEGRTWLERALKRGAAASAGARARALFGLGMVAYHLREYERSTDLLSESLALCREVDDQRTATMSLLRLGTVAMAGEDYGGARPLLADAVALAQDLGLREWVVVGRHELALVALGEGDAAGAESLLRAALEEARQRSDPWEIALCLDALAVVALTQGIFASAAARYNESRVLRRELADPGKTANWLAGVATLASARGLNEPAARLFGTAAALNERAGESFHPPLRTIYDRGGAVARTALGEAAFAAARDAGRVVSFDDAVAEVAHVLLAASRPNPPSGSNSASDLGLTPREVEVLRLVAEGRSDREIAAALFISPKTVGLHIAHLLPKLGVPSRAAAVAFAHRHGLA